MSAVRNLVELKANVLGTIAIACIASLTTSLATSYFSSEEQAALSSSSPATFATSVIECGSEVYSPVQKKCVDQKTFDMEMQRLFAALGIDTEVYGLGKGTE